MSEGSGQPERDAQRARVYAAEELWRAQLDAARRGARTICLAGSMIVLPEELRFANLDAVREWLRRSDFAEATLGRSALTVRVRKGQTQAHYAPPGTIALPVPALGEPWALRESVVLHEVAHHVAGVAVGHGPAFTGVMVSLVAQTLGAEAAFALGVHYGEAGARVAPVADR